MNSFEILWWITSCPDDLLIFILSDKNIQCVYHSFIACSNLSVSRAHVFLGKGQNIQTISLLFLSSFLNTFFVSMIPLEGVLLTPVSMKRNGCRGFWPCSITDVTTRALVLFQYPWSFPPSSHLTIYLWLLCVLFSLIIWVSFCFYLMYVLPQLFPNEPGLGQCHHPAGFLATWSKQYYAAVRAVFLFYGSSKIACFLLVCLHLSVQSEGNTGSLVPPPHRETSSVNTAAGEDLD